MNEYKLVHKLVSRRDFWRHCRDLPMCYISNYLILIYSLIKLK